MAKYIKWKKQKNRVPHEIDTDWRCEEYITAKELCGTSKKSCKGNIELIEKHRRLKNLNNRYREDMNYIKKK